MWKKNDMLINNISIPSTITLEKPYLFEPSMIESPIVIRVSPINFLYTFDWNINIEVDEINIIFVSDLRAITLSHYMPQPRSLLCRKREKKLLLETLEILITTGCQIVLEKFIICRNHPFYFKENELYKRLILMNILVNMFIIALN